MKATVTVDPRRVIGSIDRRVYGQLLEHVGRAVYGGVYDPASLLADENGLRSDVAALLRELAPTVIRWPGGNFASGYHWRDGVGPAAERPARHDLAWDTIETNAFGTEEFLQLCRAVDAEPYLAVNASTGSIDEMLAWVEYCNAISEVPEAALRRRGPHPEPHGVRLWGVGNENYGWWQHGHSTADEYGALTREWAKLLRWTEPSAEVIAVGAPDPDWNWRVLMEATPFIDFLSLHCYWHGRIGTSDHIAATLAGPSASEQQIVQAFGFAQAARARAGVNHSVRIAVDEWGVWSKTMLAFADPDGLSKLRRGGISARSNVDTAFEEAYDLKDAIAHASWMHVMWRQADKIGLATEAQMVNVLAPIHVDPDGAAFRHTVFWPLALGARLAGSVAIAAEAFTDARVPAPGVEGGELPALDVAATADPATGRLHLSLVNRSETEALEVDLEGIGGAARVIVLHDDDPAAGNTVDHPDRVVPVESDRTLEGTIVLPPLSHTTIVTAR